MNGTTLLSLLKDYGPLGAITLYFFFRLDRLLSEATSALVELAQRQTVLIELMRQHLSGG